MDRPSPTLRGNLTGRWPPRWARCRSCVSFGELAGGAHGCAWLMGARHMAVRCSALPCNVCPHGGGSSPALCRSISNVPRLTRVPPTLTALTGLESLVLFYSLPGEFDRALLRPDATLQLPAGRWLSALQVFATTGFILHASLAALTASSASRLAEVSISRVKEDELADILSWAGALPSLERLYIGLFYGAGSAHLIQAAAEARRRNPRLEIDTDSSDLQL